MVSVVTTNNNNKPVEGKKFNHGIKNGHVEVFQRAAQVPRNL